MKRRLEEKIKRPNKKRMNNGGRSFNEAVVYGTTVNINHKAELIPTSASRFRRNLRSVLTSGQCLDIFGGRSSSDAPTFQLEIVGGRSPDSRHLGRDVGKLGLIYGLCIYSSKR